MGPALGLLELLEVPMGPIFSLYKQSKCSEKCQSVKPLCQANKILTGLGLNLTKGHVKPGKRELRAKSVTAHCFRGESTL